ncbi:uncharacterized protein LOC112599393 isoform X2 [Melanaphis sacchari]|uniref:uncharacterized protein LOC112599393 isoform X2 n=1 Tax=Melanaphis sacchari TaxID=742174 RepID=UPI000DC15319|nr:uncharacterized protein LOC112599393 isoform X2 [Melanaphis sacchari]
MTGVRHCTAYLRTSTHKSQSRARIHTTHVLYTNVSNHFRMTSHSTGKLLGCMNTVKHKPGLQLQYLLQGGSYRNTKLHEITMIGAMPAVAVRHERRRQEKKVVCVNNLNTGDREGTSNTTGNRRPSLLTLQSPHSQTGTPITSPPYVQNSLPDIYVCSKGIKIKKKLHEIEPFRSIRAGQQRYSFSRYLQIPFECPFCT